MGLTASERAEFKALHEQAKREADTHVAQLAETTRPVSLDGPIGRVTRADALQRPQEARAALSRERGRLGKIVRALDRVDDPNFGDCAACRKPIAAERLRDDPESTLWVACGQ